MSPSTSGRRVDRTWPAMRATVSSAASRSTPLSLYDVIGGVRLGRAPPGRQSTDGRAERAGAGRSAAEDGDAETSSAASGSAVRRRAAEAPIAERSEQERAEAQRRTATQRRHPPSSTVLVRVSGTGTG